MLVVAGTSFRYWRGLIGDEARVQLVVLAICLLALSDGARYWWFAVYRIVGAPDWMLDHWSVLLFTACGSVAAGILLKLYAPIGWWWTLTTLALTVAGVLWWFMP